jgi:SET domain-containing protein
MMGSRDIGTIDPRYSCFRMRVGRSRIHGRGVFACERIPAGRKVIEYTGEKIGRAESKRRSVRAWSRTRHPLFFLFLLDRYWAVDGAVGGSGAEIINHSCEPNLRTRRYKGHILYFSYRRIRAGEELTVDYRFSAKSKEVACRCGAPRCRGTINQR